MRINVFSNILVKSWTKSVDRAWNACAVLRGWVVGRMWSGGLLATARGVQLLRSTHHSAWNVQKIFFELFKSFITVQKGRDDNMHPPPSRHLCPYYYVHKARGPKNFLCVRVKYTCKTVIQFKRVRHDEIII